MISKDKGVDLIKISKIKTKTQLKKYHKTTPINNLGYLFHYLILTNNLTGLKLYKFPIHKNNIDGLNGLMLAAREKKYSILNYLISKYKDLVYLKNKKNMNFVNYLYPRDKEYVDLIKNNNLDWGKLFTNYDKNHISGLDILFMKGDYKTIIKTIKLLNNNDINYGHYMSQPYQFKLLFNNKLDDNDIVNILKLLEEKNKDILSMVDDMGYNIAHAAILNDADNEELYLLKYLVNKLGKELNKYTPISGTHIFITAYKLGIKTNNYKKAKYILEHVMDNHYDKSNYYETDNSGNNIVTNILRYRNTFNKGDYNIEKVLLKDYDAWSIMNIYKKTPLNYIVNLDYDRYHKFVTNRPSNYKNINEIDSKWNKYLKTLPIVNEKDNINLTEYQYVHSNMFQSRFTDVGIFVYYLREKYKKSNTPLYIPIYKGDDVIPEWDDDMKLPDELLNFNNNFPWIIIWNNENSYWIHPHLNELIKKNSSNNSKNNSTNNYKAACVFLSLRLPDGGLHAGVLFYNFETNVIERFDPYGNTTSIDGKLDIILGEKLTEGLDSASGSASGWKYCSPGCYLPVSGFQTLSDENNILNQKMGDFGGYCLAWCIWYVEHKLNNMKVEPKDLVRKTINRLMNMNIKPMEYIRNYANYISKFRFGYLKQLGIPTNIVSNEHLNNNYLNLIKESIIIK
jgi:hypothetical protein